MKRYTWIILCFLFIFLFPSPGIGYLLSPTYVLKKMVLNYRSLRSVTAVQRVEAYGEDATYPFASVDEKVEIQPIVPVKIWIEGKEISSASEVDPELNVNQFLITAQRRYGFYKDVFMNHEVNLIGVLLGTLGIVPTMDRLRLLYPHIAYQIGDRLTRETLKGLWVDKDRFIPLRLVGVLRKKEEGFPEEEIVDIQYGDYRLLKNKIWYPFDVKFFVNGKLSLRIKTLSASLTTDG